ncbi:MAG: hypothetical protein BMS9Abin33_0649 [Gammaproteobacteria bacterium]|nr:MAG: hypothetical protein BMS9Abin33_0649 [Gammaproteobacteria bacterium]
MEKDKLVGTLRDQSTWRLFGLSFITLGVYGAHYIKKQTLIINKELQEVNKISDGLLNMIILFYYLSLTLLISYYFVDYGHPLERVGDIVDLTVAVMTIIWGFKARNRMNTLLSISKKDDAWFHGFWTFVFTPFYFNYHVNCLHELKESE